MLQPKRTKFRKAHKGRIHGDAKGGTALNFGAYGLKAMEPERITARQIEAARRAITRHIKRQGRLWIRIFPDVPVSSKPAEVRMGSGKGSPEYLGRAGEAGPHPVRAGRRSRPRSPRSRSSARPRSCRSRPRWSPALANPCLRTRKMAADRRFQDQDRRPARRAAGRAEARAVQPALPGRDQPAREAVAGPRGAPHHRPDQDAAGRALARRRQGLRS